MNTRFIIRTLGKTLLVEAVAMTSALLVALYYRESAIWAFSISIAVVMLFSVLSLLVRQKNTEVKALDGLILVTMVWIVLPLFGALPFVLSGNIPSFVDALFETVSGFTTTGASIMTNVEILTRSELFWRSLTHWIGGMGVIVLLLSFTSRGNRGVMHVLKAEVPGHVVEKILPKMKSTAILLYKMYIALTLLEVLSLLLVGMPVYESLVISFATAGTGGFAITMASIGSYPPIVHWIVSFFMFAFGVNFIIYYYIVSRQFGRLFKHEEVKVYLGIVLVSILLITVNILSLYGNLTHALRDATFQVTSIISTTGFATADYTLWPQFSQFILLALMFIGANSGSTAGGLKVSRLVILLKTARIKALKLVDNKTYHVVKLDGKVVDETVVTQVQVYFVMYCLLQLFSTMLLSLDNQDMVTTSTAVFACFNNIGPGMGLVGPTGSYAMFSDFGKILLSVDMLLGRLEIYPIIVFVGHLFSRIHKKGKRVLR